MRFPKYILLTVILYCLCLGRCKNDESDVLMTILPADLHLSVKVNDLISFYVSVSAKIQLNKFRVYSQPENGVLKTELDSNLGGISNFSYEYQYLITPALSGKNVSIRFQVIDVNGNPVQNERLLMVANYSKLLTETTGNVIWSTFSGKPDGFDIESGSQEFSLTAPDSMLDVMVFDTIASDSTLSRIWTSKSGAKFVQFNGFDYANATNISAANAYESGTKLAFISGLNSGDIIITKTMGSKKSIYAVIKITNIVDLPGIINDRYEFNLKK